MWFVFALAVSWFHAFYYIGNQNSRLKPTLYIIYRGLLTAVSVLPALLFFMPDFQWQYFPIVIVQGLAISFTDLKYFHALKKFGAENVCAIKPLTVLITFALWLVIRPYMLTYYLNNLIRSLIIISSISLIVYATVKYRSHRVGLKCFAQVFPLLFLSSIIDTCSKLAMDYANGHLMAASLWRVFITGCIIGVINLSVARQHNLKMKEIVKWKNIRKSAFILLLSLSMITVNFSLYYAENPAYTSAVIYLSIIWIMLINYVQKLMGSKKTYKSIAKRWIFTLLIATIILIISTN